MKKKPILSAIGVSAFITFFCWVFPALKGAEVNWLHAALSFVAFAVVTFAVSMLSGGALNTLLDREDNKKDEEQKGNR